MGATNSTPRTVVFINPTPKIVHVSPAVMERIENATHQHMTVKPPMPEIPIKASTDIPSLLQVKTDELEKKYYVHTIRTLESIVGKPVHWCEDCDVALKDMQKQVVNCYKNHPHESLRCADLTKKYHQFVFQQQFKAILSHKQIYSYPQEGTEKKSEDASGANNSEAVGTKDKATQH